MRLRMIVINVLFAITPIALLITFLCVLPAFAADVSPTAVDFSPILTQLIELVALLLAAVVAWAISRLQAYLRKKIGLDIDAQMRAVIDGAVNNAIAFGAAKAKELAAANATIDVKNAQLKLAADYVVAHAPDALAHFGVTPEALERRIIAALPSN